MSTTSQVSPLCVASLHILFGSSFTVDDAVMEFCIHSWLFLILTFDSKYKYYRATKSLDLR